MWKVLFVDDVFLRWKPGVGNVLIETKNPEEDGNYFINSKLKHNRHVFDSLIEKRLQPLSQQKWNTRKKNISPCV